MQPHPFHINWPMVIVIASLPGNILAIEAIVRQAAVDNGYTKVVSLCDRLAKIVSFLGQIIHGVIKLKLGGSNGQTSNSTPGAGSITGPGPSTNPGTKPDAG